MKWTTAYGAYSFPHGVATPSFGYPFSKVGDQPGVGVSLKVKKLHDLGIRTAPPEEFLDIHQKIR